MANRVLGRLARALGSNSLQWKLPIAVSALLLMVLAILLWLTYREAARSATEIASRRLTSAAQELAAAQGREVAIIRRTASDAAARPEISRYLAAPGPATQSAALAAMQQLTTRRNFAAVGLRDANGNVLLSLGSPRVIATLSPASLLAEASADSAFAGKLRAFEDTAIAPTIVPINRNGRAGYLDVWVWMRATPAEQRGIVRLMGAEAVDVLFGQDDFWTDGLQMVRLPQSVARPGGIAGYDRDGTARLTAIVPVPGSAWNAGVEFSEQLALGPARRVVRLSALPEAIVLIIALLGVWLASRQLTGPLAQLTAAAKTMSDGDFSVRVHIAQQDELGQLASAFNHMTERVQDSHHRLEANLEELHRTQQQMIQAQKMEAVGTLAGGIAHDFNNLLTIILGETDLALMGDGVHPQLRESFTSIRKAGEQAAGLTKQLLAFSRRQLVQPTVFDVNDLLTDLSKMLRRLIGEDVELTTRTAASNASVLADRGQIEQVIMNLAVNARDAMPNGGRLILETGSITLDASYAQARTEVVPGEYVVLTVSDTGSGMTPEVQSQIFEPFFTTKAPGRGTGLGLATCFGIMKQCGGHIGVYSEVGVGTTFKVYLPAAPETAPAVVAPRVSLPTGNEVVLITEDDEAVRRVAVRILRSQGYQVLEAADGNAALMLLSSSELPIDLLLTDVVLPRIGGRELAERAQALRPGLKVLFASGYTDDVILQHRLIAHDVTLVQKPFTAETLGRKVREVLDAPARSITGIRSVAAPALSPRGG